MPEESPDDGAIRDVTRRLEAAYQDRCSSEEVSTAVSAAFEHFKDSRIRDFVPVLAERVARAALDGRGGGSAGSRQGRQVGQVGQVRQPDAAVDPAAPAAPA
ncbi:three-helix bundle dimerization domain-containing protein [Streptacidiphilus neutrinimicus]|uniref:three-helix bundle dimerization domain-containing protein n=1 Tax=Streptacidiphilus neutrinimicus TaxID=105420 RepID=UPI0034E2EE00